VKFYKKLHEDLIAYAYTVDGQEAMTVSRLQAKTTPDSGILSKFNPPWHSTRLNATNSTSNATSKAGGNSA
jgi:hypothetical protein